MWTRTRCIARAGRSPRSPGTWVMTARPSAPTSRATGSPGSAGQPGPTHSSRSSPTARERLAEDPHLWAQTLFDEVVAIGYDRSYPTFTRQLRTRGRRPHCEPCAPARGRASAVIAHPPGEETQWDWVELPDPPEHWGWGGKAFLLVGALAHSGRWRGVLAPCMDQPHLIDALDWVTRALSGLTRVWRFNRMATVCHPGCRCGGASVKTCGWEPRRPSGDRRLRRRCCRTRW
jgi:hypothetical protein